MKGASVKMRGAKVMSIEIGPVWTYINIRVRTDSLAAQGAHKILGEREGGPARRKIRSRSQKTSFA